MNSYFYRPQRSCGQGNVCHSIHGGGGGSASVHTGIPPSSRDQTPFPSGTPPLPHTHPSGTHTPTGTLSPCTHSLAPPPGTTPAPPSRGSRPWHTVKERPTGMHSCSTLFLRAICPRSFTYDSVGIFCFYLFSYGSSFQKLRYYTSNCYSF